MRRPFLSPLLVLPLLAACHQRPPVQIERRVPVDVIADCMALRQRLSECKEHFADIQVERRARRSPEYAERVLTREGFKEARREALAELSAQGTMSEEDLRATCRIATAETPLPSPEDVARLHSCLVLGCSERVACLRPLMLPPRR